MDQTANTEQSDKAWMTTSCYVFSWGDLGCTDSTRVKLKRRCSAVNSRRMPNMGRHRFGHDHHGIFYGCPRSPAKEITLPYKFIRTDSGKPRSRFFLPDRRP